MTAKVCRDSAQFSVAKKGVRTSLMIITSGTYSDHCTAHAIYSIE
jgi:hypothetical protein